MRFKSLVALVCLVIPFFAYAGCESAKKDLFIINLKTNEITNVIKGGSRLDCINAYSTSHLFKKGNFKVSSFVCSDHCKKGVTPSETYVVVGKVQKEGQTEYKDGQFCLIPNGGDVKYCWEE